MLILLNYGVKTFLDTDFAVFYSFLLQLLYHLSENLHTSSHICTVEFQNSTLFSKTELTYPIEKNLILSIYKYFRHNPLLESSNHSNIPNIERSLVNIVRVRNTILMNR